MRIKNIVASKSYFYIYCFFFIWMICTTLTEVVFNMSIYAILVLYEIIPTGLLYVPPILSASTVFEVIQILGFGSALFAWAETAMKKSVLGLTYSAFLPVEFRFSKWIINMHLVATVMCIMLSAAGASEGAVVSLLLIFMGFVYLWVIVDNFLLSSGNREKEAKKKWQTDINAATKSLDEENLWKYLQILTKELSICEIKYEEPLIDCIADALVSYAHISEKCDSKAIRHNINNLSNLWSTISDLPQFKQTGRIQNLVLKLFKNSSTTVESMAIIGCSYALFLFQHFVNSSGDRQSDTCEKCILQVRNALFSFEFGLNGQCRDSQLDYYNELIKYTNATYMAIVWMFFITGRIPLSRELVANIDISAGKHEDLILVVLCIVFMMDEKNPEYNTFLNKFNETCVKFGWRKTGGMNNAGTEGALEKKAVTC